jgi:hypothetical protein
MLKELYLISVAIYIFSYIPLLFKKEKKMYKLFLSLIYTGFAVQTLIFFYFFESLRGSPCRFISTGSYFSMHGYLCL